MQMNSVCKDCKERTVGCHSTCERYIKVKTQYEEEKSRRREKELYEREAITVQVNSCKRRRRHAK